MKHFFITGVGKGIGKALAEELLKDGESFVTGYGRTNTIEHKNYNFQKLDLLDLDALKNFSFPQLERDTEVHLINNAGVLEEVKYVGDQDPFKIKDTYTVNLLAPHILCNHFISAYKDLTAFKSILNISSGAARYPIDGWSTYCASKAAIDMLTQVLSHEESLKKRGFSFFAVAPGIVDTGMQNQIRSADPGSFSRVKDFIAYKEEDQLLKPAMVAEKLTRILYKEKQSPEPVFALKDFR